MSKATDLPEALDRFWDATILEDGDQVIMDRRGIDYDASVGDVVKIEAVDWGIYTHEMPREGPFDVVRAVVYGEVLSSDENCLTIAPQVFSDGGVRFALSLPWQTVLQVTILEPAEPDDKD